MEEKQPVVCIGYSEHLQHLHVFSFPVLFSQYFFSTKAWVKIKVEVQNFTAENMYKFLLRDSVYYQLFVISTRYAENLKTLSAECPFDFLGSTEATWLWIPSPFTGK